MRMISSFLQSLHEHMANYLSLYFAAILSICQVVDPVGNAADPVARLIFVACPPTETYCRDPQTSRSTCTRLNICGLTYDSSASGKVTQV